MCQEDVSGITNSADPDQSLIWAYTDGSTCLPQNLV